MESRSPTLRRSPHLGVVRVVEDVEDVLGRNGVVEAKEGRLVRAVEEGRVNDRYAVGGLEVTVAEAEAKIIRHLEGGDAADSIQEREPGHVHRTRLVEHGRELGAPLDLPGNEVDIGEAEAPDG